MRVICQHCGLKGYGGVEHFPPMDQEDLKTLCNDCHALNSNTPVGLQNNVWFEIICSTSAGGVEKT